MSRRRLSHWSVGLVLAIALWATHGPATQAAAELRALAHCAHDCGHDPGRSAAPSRCCGVSPGVDDALAAAPTAPPMAPALLLATAAPADGPLAAPSLAAIAGDGGARAAPVFLLTRSLRI